MGDLIILGNGFDLAHELPTKYSDFRDFTWINNREFYEQLTKYIFEDDLWNDFENALGSFDEYWNYHKSIPVDVFPNLNNPEELEILDKEITAKSAYYQQEKEMFDAAIKLFTESFNERKFPIYWGNSKLIADSPEKAEGTG